MSRAEKAAKNEYKPIGGVKHFLCKKEFINAQNLRTAYIEQYIKGYEQAEKDMIERATDWCLSHVADYFGFSMVYPEKFKEDFRKAMEEE